MAEFTENVRRNMCIQEILGNICLLPVFLIRKRMQEN